MTQQFYNQFISPGDKLTAIFGDQLKSTLINILARESVNQGYNAIVLADRPMRYPVEGKVLVCDDLDVLHNLIDPKNPELIYIASKIKNDLLQPFTKKNIDALAKNTNQKLMIYLSVDAESKLKLNTSLYLKNARLICSVNFNLLRDYFPQFANLKTLKTKSMGEQISGKLNSVLKKMCSEFTAVEEKEEKILFIDQVKGLYDENVIISIFKNIKSQLNCKILIGNSNSLEIKAI